jgi:photosystem II stability/assembly factor-like uncharacterized protein
MGGRVVAVAVVESKPAVMYAASASGGLWKTVNNGTTWTPVFDQYDTVSIGDVAVASSNPEVVWVGTGEANPRNSVSWGNGLYRSTDGGKTWEHKGLAETAHIGRIVIHPTNPDIVYVAALGRLWGPNPERGLYKTTDGGRTWRQLFLNADTGFIDLVMDPRDPDILYAAAYQVRRGPFAAGNPTVQTGPCSGLYKTTDAGQTWNKLTKGLPERPLGRCGLAVSRKDPRLVYAVIQTDKTSATTAGQAAKTSPLGDAIDLGGIFRSRDRGETWTKLNDLCPRPFYYGQIRIDPTDDDRIYVLGLALHVSSDGGKTFQNTGARDVHADHHALWIDPRDPGHLVLGGDGGLHFSYDRGATWEHLTNLPIAQFYAVAVDMQKPYRVYGGLQDNGTWGGPSATRRLEGILTADWYRILGTDGFHCQVDPTNPNLIYAEGQWGALHRIDLRTGSARDIRPRPAKGAPAYRFNWSSPVLLSPHNARTVYYGGNHLFRSRDRGDTWEEVSPDLTLGQLGPSSEYGHTLTMIAESPLKAGLLLVGTDDGRVQVSRDGGQRWIDRSDQVPALNGGGWISRLEWSHAAEGTAYLAVARHRLDDRAPYVYRTTDHGATWQSLAADLPPEGPVHVIREDLHNPHLLFVGTEFGLFVSVDTGKHWRRLRDGLPTVAVHDLVIHPRDRELVIATHGRGIYVMDIAPLQELTPQVLAARAHLFDIKPAAAFEPRRTLGTLDSKMYRAANPPLGATIYYYLKAPVNDAVAITIADARGAIVANLKGPHEAGLHRVTWNLRLPTAKDADEEKPLTAPGEYAVQVKAGNRMLTKRLRIEAAE